MILGWSGRFIKVHGLKILKTYKLCWRTLWTSLPTSTSTSLVFARLSSVFPNELVLVSLAPCHSLNEGCKRYLKRFHTNFHQNKTLFDSVSTGFDVHFLSCTCWLFIKKSLMRSEIWQLQSQWNWTYCYKLGNSSSMWLVFERKILSYGELWRKLLRKLK